MSDHNTNSPLRRDIDQRHARKALSNKAWPIVAGVLTAGAILAAATTSFAQGGPGYGPGNGPGYGYGRSMMGPGGGPDGAGPGFGRGWRGGSANFDPAAFEARADRMVRHLAVELGATAEQQEKLGTIVKAALKDLLPVREKMLAARKQGRALLTAEKVDRAAIEKLRAEQIAAHDTASKRLVQALADAAEVLTPEQRKKLDTFLPEGGRGFGFGRGHGFGRGMGGGMGGWGMGGWGMGWR